MRSAAHSSLRSIQMTAPQGYTFVDIKGRMVEPPRKADQFLDGPAAFFASGTRLFPIFVRRWGDYRATHRLNLVSDTGIRASHSP